MTRRLTGAHASFWTLLPLLLPVLAILSEKCAEGAAAPGGGARGPAGRVVVSDAAESRRLRALPGTRVAVDYGSFQLLEIDPALLPSLAGRPGVEVPGDVLFFNGGPVEAVPGVASVSSLPGEGKRLHVLKLAGPILPEWLDELRSFGLEIVDYVPPYAYLVYGPPGAIAAAAGRVSAAGPLRWAGEYAGKYKVAQSAADATPVQGAWTVQLVLDPEANAATKEAIDRLRTAPGGSELAVERYVNVVAALSAQAVAEVAARPDVISIHPWSPPVPSCERQGVIVSGRLVEQGESWAPASPGYLAWLESLGFSAAGFAASGLVVDVTDSGIDNGTTSPNHPGLALEGDPRKGSRVAYNQIFGRPGTDGGRGCSSSHGTLNAHIVAGFDDTWRAGNPRQDAAGFHPGLGICPWVKVGSSVIFDPGWTNGFGELDPAPLLSHAFSNGARVSANSWGRDNKGLYEPLSQAYDMLVRDARPEVPGNQEMVVVFAAGNEGPDSGTIDTPASAKNLVTVGASTNVNPFGVREGGTPNCPSDNDDRAGNANGIAPFSSRGNTRDGRAKPDLVAPGTHISGGVIQAPNPPEAGKVDPCYTGKGICGGPRPDGFWPLGQQLYSASSGTSHSTPAVAAGAVLVQQRFFDRGGPAPSPALVKAILMNSTRFLTALGADETLPSPRQGMGLMDLGRAFDDAPRVLVDQSERNTFTSTGQVRTFEGKVADGRRPFRVSLAFTDAPGSTAGAAYCNDLDLVVTVGGVSYRGNVFAGRASAPGGSADRKNNVESVFLPEGTTGPYRITVTAANVAAVGVPGGPGTVNQDFALVVYNGVDTAAASFELAGTTVSSEECAPANGAADPGERVSYDVTLKNVGTRTATGVEVRLEASALVKPLGGAVRLGDVAAGSSGKVTIPFRLAGSAACGGDVVAALLLSESGGASLGSVTLVLPVGRRTEAAPRLLGAGGIDVPVPADETPATVPIVVSGTGAVVESLRVRVRIEQTTNGRLSLSLVGPGGESVVLSAWKGTNFGTGTGCDGEPTVFDDAARSATAEALEPFAGPHRPAGRLATFRGVPLDGTWKLRVQSAGGDARVRCFQLEATPRQAWCCGSAGAASLRPAGAVAVGPSCPSAGGGISPGETALLDLGLRNQGTAPSGRVSARLEAGGGVLSPGPAEEYGVLVPGAGAEARRFTFVLDPAWPCGRDLPLSLRLFSDGVDAGQATFTVATGTREKLLVETFDAVVPPALPAGWKASGPGGEVSWRTSALKAASPPASAWMPDGTPGDSRLEAPPVLVNARGLSLRFAIRPAFQSPVDFYSSLENGAVLEVSLDGGEFLDVLGAGGTFRTGGYDGLLEGSNPMGARPAWARSSEAFFPVIVDLPDSFFGRLARFRFRAAFKYWSFLPQPGGIFLDDVRLEGRPLCCGSPGCTILSASAAAEASAAAPANPLSFRASAIGTGCPGLPEFAWSFGDGTASVLGEKVLHAWSSRGEFPWTMTAVWAGATVRKGGLVRIEEPEIEKAGAALAAESCLPANGAIDPGESVTVSFSLRNVGNQKTVDLLGELLPTGGVVPAGRARSFGSLAPGGEPVTVSFPFAAAADLACGSDFSATIRLSDGTKSLGTVSFPFRAGATAERMVLVEPFPAPDLAGWASEAVEGTGASWSGVSTADSPPVAPHSPPAMARFVSSRAQEGDIARLKRTSGVDLSGMAADGKVTLRYWTWCGGFDPVDGPNPEVSTDGGANWAPAPSTAACPIRDVGWIEQSADLTEIARGKKDVRVAFWGVAAFRKDGFLDDVRIEATWAACCGAKAP